jgi:hypothetical protein
MADFLTRLVERNMGAAPQVQPVIAPIFAPAPPLAEDVTLEPGPAAEVSGRAPVAAMPIAQAPAAEPAGPPAVAASVKPARSALPLVPPAAAQRPDPVLPAAHSLEETSVESGVKVEVAALTTRPAEPPAPRPTEAIGQHLTAEVASPIQPKPAAGPAQPDVTAQPAHARNAAPPAPRPVQHHALLEREIMVQPVPSDIRQVATAPTNRHESAPLVEQPQGPRPRSDSMALVRPQPAVAE